MLPSQDTGGCDDRRKNRESDGRIFGLLGGAPPTPPNSVSGDNLGYKIISAEVLRNATFFDEDWELNDKGGR